LLLHRQQRLGVAFGVIDGVVGVFGAAEVLEVGWGVLHETFVEAAQVRGRETKGNIACLKYPVSDFLTV
jgi:hypothetical protein